MKLYEVLEPGKRYKVGAREAFIWCGTFNAEGEAELKEESTARLKIIEKQLRKDKIYIQRSTENPVRAIKTIMTARHLYVRDNLTSDEAEAELKHKLRKARRRVKKYQERIDKWVPIMFRDVKEIFTSQADSDVTIVLVPGDERGKYWDEAEYMRDHKGENND